MSVYMIICDADISPVTGTGKYYVGKHRGKGESSGKESGHAPKRS